MNTKRYVKGLRIHRKQLASSSINGLMKEVKAIEQWRISPHFEDQSRGRNVAFPKEPISDLIKDSTLIEFHTLKDSRRVLLRHEDTGISFIVDLDAKVLVSVWANALDDNHNTLDTSKYLFGR